jgi:hypothetical protein
MSAARPPGIVLALVALAAFVPSAGGCGDGGGSGPDADAGPDAATDAPVETPDVPDARESGEEAADVRPEAEPDAEDAGEDPGPDAEPDADPDVPPPPEMNFYFGNFHSHTSFSEGVGPPSENYAWARDVAGFDFYAVTDHAELVWGDEWDDTATQADAANEDGVFVTLRGFEWSHTLIGHSCVFGTGGYTNAVSDFLLSMFYDWVDGNTALAQFNHPGREWLNFDDLNFEADVADNFFAIEVANKGDSIAEGEYLAYYAQALDKGWHVAPTSNQDNHEQTANCHRSVYLGPELSRSALLDAMLARRIYATDDPNLRLTFRWGDVWMGTRVPAPGGSVVFTIRVVDDEPITLVELVSNGGAVIFNHVPPPDATEVTWEPEVWVTAGQWYYVKVTGTDLLDAEPPSQTAVSAAIWFD